MKHCAYHWSWAFSMAVAFGGCQSSEDVAVAPVALITAAPATSSATLPQPKRPASTADKKKPESSGRSDLARFTPPFPHRQEMFEPPKRAQGAVRRTDQDGESVVLMGFVNVDRPRAILSIDGVIAPIHEGGEKYGVQVQMIQPPSVVLQRGRNRWTATLE